MENQYEDILTDNILGGRKILSVDIELESANDRFPDPNDPVRGKILCITLSITGVDDIICYGIGEISRETRSAVESNRCTYIRCKGEDDMLTRAILYIEALKPTHVRDCAKDDLNYLHSRAWSKRIKVDVPDLDRMFRQYDKSFSELYGIPSGKKSCPIAEEAWRKYNSQRRKQ